jgi:hypothetical protein
VTVTTIAAFFLATSAIDLLSHKKPEAFASLWNFNNPNQLNQHRIASELQLPYNTIMTFIEGERTADMDISTQFINLLEMGQNHKSSLADKIAASGGKVNVIVHPFTEVSPSLPPEELPPYLIEQGKQKSEIIRLIASPEHPSIILEESSHIAVTQLILGLHGIKPVYFIPTAEAHPRPAIGGKSEEQSWEIVHYLFSSLGIRSILIAGRYFWPDARGEPQGCVGHTARKLQVKFRTKILTELCLSY